MSEELTTKNDGPRTVLCGFCNSKLTRSGEIIKLGDDAIAYRDSPELNKKLAAEKLQLEKDLADARATIADLKKKLAGDDDAGDGDDDPWD